MKTAKNDPGLKVGDKIRMRFTWIEENDNLVIGEFLDLATVKKVNSRYFYTVRHYSKGTWTETRDPWGNVTFEKDGDNWLATVSLGKIPVKEE